MKQWVIKRVVFHEVVGFGSVAILIWLNEIIDIPHLLFGAPPTPLNWKESAFESASILLLGGVMVYFSVGVIRRLKFLEGILPVCAGCKKIRDDQGTWRQIESFISDRSNAKFSHGLCPECALKFYPGYDLEIPETNTSTHPS